MIRRPHAALVAIPILLAGCQSDPPTTPQATLVLRLDEVAVVGTLSIVWRELADSRCPQGVECVWEGEAVVTVELTRGAAPGERLQLSLRPTGPPARGTAAGAELTLLRVEPYPRAGVTTPRSDYAATVQIREL